MDLAYKTNLRAGAPAVHSTAHVMAGTQNEKGCMSSRIIFSIFWREREKGEGILRRSSV